MKMEEDEELVEPEVKMGEDEDAIVLANGIWTRGVSVESVERRKLLGRKKDCMCAGTSI